MKDKLFRPITLGTYSLAVLFMGIPLIGVLTSEYMSGIQGVEGQRLWRALQVSLMSSLGSMTIITLVGMGTAYVKTFHTFKGKRYLDVLLGLPLVLPPAVTGIFLLLTFGVNGCIGKYLLQVGIQLTFTTQAVIIVQVFVGLPLFVQIVSGYFENIDNKILESAKIEGCNEWQSFWYMILPLTQRGIISGCLMCFARILAEFGGTMLFAGNIEGKTQTLPLAIYSAMESNMSEALLIAIVLLGMASILTITVEGRRSRVKD